MPPTRRDRLLKRATKGDKTVLPELRRLLDAEPWLWQQAGDLSVQAERSWISMVAGENLVASESAPRKMDALRRELAGPNPSVLERLLVDRVVLCWFQVNYCETLFAQWAKDLTIPQADYHQRRLDRAHGRYLLAIRTLACVRRLLVAPVQVNIGAQQVNVANANESGLPR
jgi:hypothetical protein